MRRAGDGEQIAARRRDVAEAKAVVAVEVCGIGR